MADRACSFEGCEKRVHARDWCAMHYQRWRVNGDPAIRAVAPPRRRDRRVGVESCAIDGCDRLMKARGWCDAHYTRWQRHGSPTARLRGEIVDGKRICSQCQVDKDLGEFTNSQTSWCRKCVARIANDRRPAWVPVVGAPKQCDNCESIFMANGRRRRYCSARCAGEHRHKANWKHVQKRRARLRGGVYESFDRREIFDRDGWVCQLCWGGINRDLAFPALGSASLDHIVPVSLGGPHTRANTQASHLGCNMAKSNRLTEAAA